MPLLTSPQKRSLRKQNIITIISMGRSTEVPKICDLYINVTRVMKDDFAENWRTGSDSGRGMITGEDTFVQNTICAIYQEFFDSLIEVIISMADKETLLDSGLVIMIACSMGERRSVASVEILGKLLTKLGYNCEVHHKELEKWLKF
jgi:RNase adaptor protein for sRNA GlmZ degradation